MPVKKFIENAKLKFPDLPDEFLTALTAEYETDETVWTQKLTTAESAVEPVTTENAKLRDQLWDYMMNKSGTPIPDNNSSGGQVPPVAGDDPNEYKPKGLLAAAFGTDEAKE